MNPKFLTCKLFLFHYCGLNCSLFFEMKNMRKNVHISVMRENVLILSYMNKSKILGELFSADGPVFGEQ